MRLCAVGVVVGIAMAVAIRWLIPAFFPTLIVDLLHGHRPRLDGLAADDRGAEEARLRLLHELADLLDRRLPLEVLVAVLGLILIDAVHDHGRCEFRAHGRGPPRPPAAYANARRRAPALGPARVRHARWFVTTGGARAQP